jgi:predicted transcriptional regulator
MKRTFKEVRKAILQVLSDNKEHVYGDLERKVNTNWQTIREHCKDLELFEAVVIKDNKVKITKKGLELLKKVKDD